MHIVEGIKEKNMKLKGLPLTWEGSLNGCLYLEEGGLCLPGCQGLGLAAPCGAGLSFPGLSARYTTSQ